MTTVASTMRDRLRYDEPMGRYTSWRTGGAARRFFQPSDVADLQRFLAELPADEPLLWIGLGSNLLVRDGGWPGTVIRTQRGLRGLERVDAMHVRAEAGVPCAKVARFCTQHDLGGAEFLAGIPGTMGGALAMNAGAFGGETWERVVAVETIDRKGTLRRRDSSDYRIGYRTVEGPDEWFVACTLRLDAVDGAQGRDTIRELLARRGATQPTNQFSCGSVFRNPPGDHAARLIDSAGLKGLTQGGAAVSDRHANFIINHGTATAADIETLIERVRATVQEVHDVSLEREVCIVGEVSQ